MITAFILPGPLRWAMSYSYALGDYTQAWYGT